MNHDLIIRTTNRVAVYATIALIYWVFIFLTITVFDLKILRERMTEMFVLSVLGIFAVLGGAIVLNVMSNLSKISAAVSQRDVKDGQGFAGRKWKWALAALAFPVIATGLFTGDKLSAQRKKEMLIDSAERLVAENQAALGAIADYRFSSTYVKDASRKLDVIEKIDKNFPEVMLVVPDAIEGKNVYLGFSGREYGDERSKQLKKSDFIISTTREEREYLARVFSGEEQAYRFRAQKGNYDLYFPATVSGQRVVLYFSDYQRYGKYGS